VSEMSNLNRDLGVMQGELKGIVATLKRVDDRSAARDEAFEEMREELREVLASISVLQKQSEDSIEIGKKFNALSQSIRDGAMQVKGASKGIAIGIAMAGAGFGGTIVAIITYGKDLWKAIFPG
jgi:galactokinase